MSETQIQNLKNKANVQFVSQIDEPVKLYYQEVLSFVDGIEQDKLRMEQNRIAQEQKQKLEEEKKNVESEVYKESIEAAKQKALSTSIPQDNPSYDPSNVNILGLEPNATIIKAPKAYTEREKQINALLADASPDIQKIDKLYSDEWIDGASLKQLQKAQVELANYQ